MNRAECDRVLADLLAAYPTATLTQDTPRVWHEQLRQYPYEIVSDAATALARTSPRMPVLAAMVEAVQAAARERARTRALPRPRTDWKITDETRALGQQRVRELRAALHAANPPTEARDDE